MRSYLALFALLFLANFVVAQTPAERPKLVVGLVVDQMRYDYLYRYWDKYSSGGFKRLGDLRDRASLAWSAQCLSQLDPEVLTPVIEGRWLDGYDFPDALSRVRCPTLLLQADPSAGGALTDADAEQGHDQDRNPVRPKYSNVVAERHGSPRLRGKEQA